jgi:pyruvate kinase
VHHRSGKQIPGDHQGVGSKWYERGQVELLARKPQIRVIRKVSAELDQPVAILQDLGGPKIRVGIIPDPGVRLEAGQTFVLTNQPVQGTSERVSVSYSSLPEEVKEGDQILLADGFIELVVKGAERSEISCEVVTGGLLTSHKGLNLPTRSIQAPSLTDKDREDLVFGLENEVCAVVCQDSRRDSESQRYHPGWKKRYPDHSQDRET